MTPHQFKICFCIAIAIADITLVFAICMANPRVEKSKITRTIYNSMDWPFGRWMFTDNGCYRKHAKTFIAIWNVVICIFMIIFFMKSSDLPIPE
jgi:hypothetical protein